MLFSSPARRAVALARRSTRRSRACGFASPPDRDRSRADGAARAFARAFLPRVLDRGYAVVRKSGEARPLRSSADAAGRRLRIRLARGGLRARVEGREDEMTEALGTALKVAPPLGGTAVPRSRTRDGGARTVPVGGVALVRTDMRAGERHFRRRASQVFPGRGRTIVALVASISIAAPGAIRSRSPIVRVFRCARSRVEARDFAKSVLTVRRLHRADPATLARISASSACSRRSGRGARRIANGVRHSFGRRRSGGLAVRPASLLQRRAAKPAAGIDFRAPEGAPVYASIRGHVVLARELFFRGTPSSSITGAGSSRSTCISRSSRSGGARSSSAGKRSARSA